MEKPKENLGDIITRKDSKYWKEKIKKILTNKAFIGFTSAYLFYLLSLEGCYKGEGECSVQFAWITRKIIEEVISIIIMTVMLILMFTKKVSKLLRFHDHGYFNFFYYIVLLVLINILLLPMEFIICYCKKINKFTIISIYVVLLIKL